MLTQLTILLSNPRSAPKNKEHERPNMKNYVRLCLKKVKVDGIE